MVLYADILVDVVNGDAPLFDLRNATKRLSIFEEQIFSRGITHVDFVLPVA